MVHWRSSRRIALISITRTIPGWAVEATSAQEAQPVEG
jgi:hypothetical protein